MRGLVRDAILSTDMSRHANIIADIEEHLAPIHDGRAVAAAATRAQRLRWLQLVVKCADVSNVTKEFSVAREWGLMVTDEMFAQGERERDEGLEVPISFPFLPLPPGLHLPQCRTHSCSLSVYVLTSLSRSSCFYFQSFALPRLLPPISSPPSWPAGRDGRGRARHHRPQLRGDGAWSRAALLIARQSPQWLRGNCPATSAAIAARRFVAHFPRPSASLTGSAS